MSKSLCFVTTLDAVDDILTPAYALVSVSDPRRHRTLWNRFTSDIFNRSRGSLCECIIDNQTVERFWDLPSIWTVSRRIILTNCHPDYPCLTDHPRRWLWRHNWPFAHERAPRTCFPFVRFNPLGVSLKTDTNFSATCLFFKHFVASCQNRQCVFCRYRPYIYRK